jgi:hypothetical protein
MVKVAKDIINPGATKTAKLFGPIRNSAVSAGIYYPPNRWRNRTGSHILQKPRLLAEKLPRNTKFNFARS